MRYNKEHMNEETTSTVVQADGVKATDNEINIYPILRTFFLGLCVFTCIAIILFLMYLNGKSVYENGV